jgi:hypothetical protein
MSSAGTSTLSIGERSNDLHEALRVALDGRQAKMWTALPGVIQSYNAQAMTCVVQAAVQVRVTDRNNVTTYQSIKPLLDCPVVFPGGGGCWMTFPLAKGDECLVVFGSRGIDFWWQQGGVQPPAEARMHNLSDGFVIPGPFSQPRVPQGGANTRDVMVGTLDGETSISLNPQAQRIVLKAPNGGVMIDGDLTCSGDVIAGGVVVTPAEDGTPTATGGVSLLTHVHSGVQSGPSDTGPPV